MNSRYILKQRWESKNKRLDSLVEWLKEEGGESTISALEGESALSYSTCYRLCRVAEEQNRIRRRGDRIWLDSNDEGLQELRGFMDERAKRQSAMYGKGARK